MFCQISKQKQILRLILIKFAVLQKPFTNSLSVMPSCGVKNCKNYKFVGSGVRFFRIPKVREDDGMLTPKQIKKNQQAAAWIRSINREDIVNNVLYATENIRVCSEHFTNGLFFNFLAKLKNVIGLVLGYPANEVDFKHEDWYPHINMGHDCVNEIDISDDALDHFEIPEFVEEKTQTVNEVPSINESHYGFGDSAKNVEWANEQQDSVNEVPVMHNIDYKVEHATREDQRQILSELIQTASSNSTILPIYVDCVDAEVIVKLLIDQNKEILSLQQKLEKVLRNPTKSTYTQTNDDVFQKFNDLCSKQEDLISALQSRIAKCEHQECAYSSDDSRAKYYTGLNFLTLHKLYKRLEPGLPSHGNYKLSKFQCLVLTLIRCRLGCHFKDLGYRFNVSAQTASRIFHTVLNTLYVNLKQFIIWPERDNIRKTMPKIFLDKLGHNKLVCIIDCFEVFIQRPSEPMENCQVWSTYKHHQTVKFLIAMTPQGTVSFISPAYVGRTSDKYIVNDSEFLNKLLPGDYVAADRGFTIESELQLRHSKLLIPTFVKGRSQLHPQHIEETRSLASFRIHIERIIGLLKNKFLFFALCIPMSTLHKEVNSVAVVDQMVTVCCSLINLCPSIMDCKDDDI